MESEISDPQCGPRRAVGLGNSRKIYQLDGSYDSGADIIYHRSSIVQGPGYRKNRGFLERGICRNLELTRVEACSIILSLTVRGRKKSLYPLYLLGCSDFSCCYGL